MRLPRKRRFFSKLLPKKNPSPIFLPVRDKTYLWMARFASAFARHDWDKLKKLARSAKSAGIRPRELYELTLQGYLFLGFPAAIEAFGALDGFSQISPKKRERSTSARVKKGRRVCRLIYREKFPALMQNLRQKSPHLADWIIEEGYGKVLSRPGASLRLRELFSASLLAASGFPRQLFAHLRALAEMGEKPEGLAVLVKNSALGLPKGKQKRIRNVADMLVKNKNSLWKVSVSSI